MTKGTIDKSDGKEILHKGGRQIKVGCLCDVWD
jgi:hypothetical protein